MYKLLFLVCILSLRSNWAFDLTKEVKCDGSTPEISECLNKKILHAEKSLDETFNKIIKNIEDKKQVDLLKKSQKSWSYFMKQELEFVKNYYNSGTYGSVRVGHLKIQLLENRTKQLLDLVRP